MNVKVLSFIIPAYNSQAFLDTCIQSMLVPDLLDKLEIIVVNDGSSDNTAAIAETYCSQYPGVVRLICQENKGHGGALNTGCAAAEGTYLKVIDADDWVQTESLPEFVRLLESCSADVVLTHYRTIDISNGEVKNWRSYPKAFGTPCLLGDVMSAWNDFYRGLTFHGITYRTAFYQAFALPLPEHVFYEDHEYATFPCCHCQRITCFDLFVYIYRIGDIHQSVSEANQLKRIGHTQAVIQHMLNQYRSVLESDGKLYAAKKIQSLLLSYLTTVLLINPDRSQGRDQAKRILSICCQDSPEICRPIRSKYRIFYIMNRLHISMYVWNRIRNSKLYLFLRGAKSFD